MKRNHYSGRDSSPRGKRYRSRSPPDGNNELIDRYNFDYYSSRDNRRGSPNSDCDQHPGDDFNSSSDFKRPKDTYRSLCVSGLPQNISDALVKEAIQEKYTGFGEYNIKFATYNNERVAYINFRYPDSAQRARHSVQRFHVLDRQVRVEPVCNSRNKSPPRGNEVSSSRHRSSGGDSDSRRAPSPSNDSRRTSESGGGGGGGSMERSSGKREPKFPYHLDHKDPSDDPTATRTLFVGNLFYEVSDQEIHDVFEKYGIVEEIDIKRPTKGSGNAYAFIKYWNLDMAHRAKLDMSGRMIRGFQCKIGYGKAHPTRCIWVGGLGPWIQYDMLRREFSRFGEVEVIEWPQGKNYAYILYVSVDAATQACKEMRGMCLGGSENRLRLDFTDPEHIEKDAVVRKRAVGGTGLGETGGSASGNAGGGTSRHRHTTSPSVGSHSNNKTQHHRNDDNSLQRRSSSLREMPTLNTARTISDLTCCLKEVWSGWFVMKNCLFGSRMYHLRGNPALVDEFMREKSVSKTITTTLPSSPKSTAADDVEDGEKKDDTESEIAKSKRLHITQRLSLDPTKLEDLQDRVQQSDENDLCILLATAESQSDHRLSCDPSEVSRQFKSLVSYFLRKSAAGVVLLQGNTDASPGVLHCFPPSDYANELLCQVADAVQKERLKMDFLVAVLIRNIITP